jgi:hypothetical protein
VVYLPTLLQIYIVLYIMKNHFPFRKYYSSYRSCVCKNYILLNVIEILLQIVDRHVGSTEVCPVAKLRQFFQIF